MVRQLAGFDGRVTVGSQVPDAGAPLVGFFGADDFRQIHALQAREAAGRCDGSFFRNVVARHDATVLRAFLTQDARQAASVDTGDGHNIVGFQVVGQGHGVAPVASNQRQITDYQTCGPDTIRLGVFRGSTGVANMRVSQGHDLLSVGRIRQDLLVASHCGVKHHLTNGLTVGPNGFAAKNAAISEGEYGLLSQEDLP